MRLGTTEIMLLMFLALIVFGGGKLSGVGKALGTSIRDFKKEVTPEPPASPGIVQAGPAETESQAPTQNQEPNG